MKFKRKQVALACMFATGGIGSHGLDTAVAQTPAPHGTMRVEVTGTNIRRVDAETASPVQVITQEEMVQSGLYDDQRSPPRYHRQRPGPPEPGLQPARSPAAVSGVALRGLGVGATLVLIDGLRMSPYPASRRQPAQLRRHLEHPVLRGRAGRGAAGRRFRDLWLRRDRRRASTSSSRSRSPAPGSSPTAARRRRVAAPCGTRRSCRDSEKVEGQRQRLHRASSIATRTRSRSTSGPARIGRQTSTARSRAAKISARAPLARSRHHATRCC